jgi:threonine dehydratase
MSLISPAVSSSLLTERELEDAALRVHQLLKPTPTIHSRWLSDRLGASVYLKLEILQPTRSFKVRGATSALLDLTPAQRERGVVTASQGNHGAGVSWAARELGAPATVFLPRDAPGSRVQALASLGAKVVLGGKSWDEANARAIAAAQAEGQSYIHPFNDRRVMAGQGVLLLELVEQLPAVDLVVASVGGGGLLSGLLCAAHHASPATRVVGVETEGADCMSRSVQAGRIVTLPAITSIARSLGALQTEPPQLAIVSRLAHDLVVVSDQEATHALLDLLREERFLVEPAAACVVAALLAGRIPVKHGEQVVVVLCGANVELDDALAWDAQAQRDDTLRC